MPSTRYFRGKAMRTKVVTQAAAVEQNQQDITAVTARLAVKTVWAKGTNSDGCFKQNTKFRLYCTQS